MKTNEHKDDVQLGIHVHGTIVLQEARFQSFPVGEPNQSADVSDEILRADITLTGFRLLFSRKIRFTPSAFFEISVTYQSDITFDDDAGKKVLKNEDKVIEWIKNNEVRIINTFQIPAKASHLVATLCENAGFIPFVTQPAFITGSDASAT